jgi:hypothetical protein
VAVAYSGVEPSVMTAKRAHCRAKGQGVTTILVASQRLRRLEEEDQAREAARRPRTGSGSDFGAVQGRSALAKLDRPISRQHRPAVETMRIGSRREDHTTIREGTIGRSCRQMPRGEEEDMNTTRAVAEVVAEVAAAAVLVEDKGFPVDREHIGRTCITNVMQAIAIM